MSLQFSNTTTKNGILQRIERECGFNDGDITGNSTLLAQFTGDVNYALDMVVEALIKKSGTWQFDDSNHTDYPIISTNLVSGTRDYSFTSDEDGNLILDVHKVLVADSTGLFKELLARDPESESINIEGFVDGQNLQGTPTQYDKLANGILLDPIPNYNSTGGLKIYISREGSYFLTSDTTKKPGIPGLYHELLVLIPAYNFARRNGLIQVDRIYRDKTELMQKLEANATQRERDVKKGLRPLIDSTR